MIEASDGVYAAGGLGINSSLAESDQVQVRIGNGLAGGIRTWRSFSLSGQVCQADFLRGTFAPFLRASERPMAIACLRLFTVPPFPPRPDLRVPLFSRCIALFTLLPAAFPYLRPLEDFRFAIISLLQI